MTGSRHRDGRTVSLGDLVRPSDLELASPSGVIRRRRWRRGGWVLFALGWASGLLVGLLVARGTATPAGDRGSIADRIVDDEEAGDDRPPVVVAPDDLAEEVLAVRRLAGDESADPLEVLDRWEALRERAHGTEYADYADREVRALRTLRMVVAGAEMEKIVREADRRIVAGQSLRDLIDRLADLAPWLVETRFEAEYRARRGWMTLQEQARQDDRLQLQAAFTDRIVASPGIELVGAEGVRIDSAISGVRFLSVGSSHVTFAFDLPAVPDDVLLMVNHQNTLIDGLPDTSIAILINDRVLVHDWRLPNAAHHAILLTEWAIADYLRPGRNTIRWELVDGTTQYWLHSFRLRGR